MSDSINIIKLNLTLGFNLGFFKCKLRAHVVTSNVQQTSPHKYSDTITQTHTSEAPACLSRPHPFFFPLLPSRWVVFSFLPQSQKLPGTKDVIGYLSNSVATSLVTGDARTPVIGRRCTYWFQGIDNWQRGLSWGKVVLYRAYRSERTHKKRF